MLDNTATRKGIAIVIIGILIPIIILIIGQFLPPTLPVEITTAFQFIVKEIYKWEFLIPATTFFSIISLTLLIEISIFSLNIFLTIWGWIKKAE